MPNTKLDNRNKEDFSTLEEIENDETPIDENENKGENEETTDDAEQEDTQESTENPDDEELIVNDDEEIDETTGEIRKKQAPQKKQTQPTDAERLRESAKEAQLLHVRNKQFTDALAKVEEIKEPTDKELQTAAATKGLSWDELSNVEKMLFKENYINNKKLEVVNSAVRDVKNVDEWAQKVDGFIDENETKQTRKGLLGREDAFRNFSMKASHRGIPLTILASAFLQEAKPVKKNGSMFLTNTGGEKFKAKNDELDAEKVAYLRQNNQREYQRLVRAGKINIEV